MLQEIVINPQNSKDFAERTKLIRMFTEKHYSISTKEAISQHLKKQGSTEQAAKEMQEFLKGKTEQEILSYLLQHKTI